jgi:signal transduction histidine kinase
VHTNGAGHNLIVNYIGNYGNIASRQRELLILRVGRGANPGVAIALEQLHHVFNAVFTTEAKGMGMGLSTCRSIVEAHDGQSWAFSKDGTGLSFRFAVPSVHVAVS